MKKTTFTRSNVQSRAGVDVVGPVSARRKRVAEAFRERDEDLELPVLLHRDLWLVHIQKISHSLRHTLEHRKTAQVSRRDIRSAPVARRPRPISRVPSPSADTSAPAIEWGLGTFSRRRSVDNPLVCDSSRPRVSSSRVRDSSRRRVADRDFVNSALRSL